MKKKVTRALIPIALAAASFSALLGRAKAEAPSMDAFHERCATRLSIAFTGKSPSKDAAASPTQEQIDTYLASEDFRERFARFINTEFNSAPGASALEDAPYYLAKRVLQDQKPWSNMFLGKYRLAPIASNVAVFEDDNQGLGYFRSEDWYRRYEGNEEQGTKLATAYRIMNNVVGLKLTAVTASPNADQTATGRKAAPCNGCHFDGWFALDKVAEILPKKGQRFDAYAGGAREMLGGKQIANDRDLVTALVESENFSVNACRLAFKFLYAREDNRCEGPILDRCVDTFKTEKTMTAALSSIAREPGFCE